MKQPEKVDLTIVSQRQLRLLKKKEYNGKIIPTIAVKFSVL